MDFRNVNKFNALINVLSGNFLPLDSKNTSLGFICAVYMIFTWFAKLIYLFATTIGLMFHESTVLALQASGINTLVSLEMLIVTVYMNSRRRFLRNLIRKFNYVLVDSDFIKQHIQENVDPPMKQLKIYSIVAISSVALWTAMPIVKVFYTERFTYTDFSIPTYLPGAPFTITIFLCGLLIDIIGAVYVLFKKVSNDVYIIHFITLLTAEYQYVHEQISCALRQENVNEKETSVIVDLRKCVRHHSIVIGIGQMLAELLSLNVGLTYLNCILRFCILGFCFITITDAYFEKCLYLLYTTGSLIQVYILCSCTQQLLEASTSVSDDAFHENWHGRGRAVKNIFRTITLSNKIECRLTAFRVVDLTVPTFGSILHQAYSACILLLRIN